MSFAPLYLLLVTIINCGLAQNSNITKVSVAVYYEALCPDSQKFITAQLYPTLQNKNISDWIDLELVPYGKSNTTVIDGDQYQFQCQHGPAECLGNKLQACAIHEIEAIAPKPVGSGFNPITLALINCLMSKAEKNESHFDELLKNCSEINKVPQYVNIETCGNHVDGSKYLAEQGNLTDRIEKPLSYVPTIVFNGKFNKDVSKAAETNFVKSLCKHITGSEKLAECKNGSATLTVSFVTLAIVLLKQMF